MNRIWTYILVGILAFSLVTVAGCLGDDDEGDGEDDDGDNGGEEELASESTTLEMGISKEIGRAHV